MGGEALPADRRSRPQDRCSASLDAEVVWLDSDGATNFDALNAVALAFDLMSVDGEDFRQEPYSDRKGGAA